MMTLSKTNSELLGSFRLPVVGGWIEVLLRRCNSSYRAVLVLALTALITMPAQGRSVESNQEAPTYQVVYGFRGGDDGADVTDKVIIDTQGNIYGVTALGGSDGVGIVFELMPQPKNQWKKTTIYNFQATGPARPYGGVVMDRTGTLYGTTQFGGTYNLGTIFQLSPNGSSWDFSELYSFGALGDDAGGPWDSLLMSRSGDLLGTGGSVFELSPFSNVWQETIIHSFDVKDGDGYMPQAGLISDNFGNLYSMTTYGGGSPRCPDYNGCGTVFKLTSIFDDAVSDWKEQILHAFGFVSEDGAIPGLGNLAMDMRGSLYGTTAVGGANGYGTVFKLTSSTTGHWHETILYNFTGSSDGSSPSGGVILGPGGSLYGTTIAGGSNRCGCGVIYKVSPQPTGQWQYTTLHTFTGPDGAEPDASLTIDGRGILYGTTLTGGPGGAGIVFEIKP